MVKLVKLHSPVSVKNTHFSLNVDCLYWFTELIMAVHYFSSLCCIESGSWVTYSYLLETYFPLSDHPGCSILFSVSLLLLFWKIVPPCTRDEEESPVPCFTVDPPSPPLFCTLEFSHLPNTLPTKSTFWGGKAVRVQINRDLICKC